MYAAKHLPADAARFEVCKNCGHRISAFIVLKRSGLLTRPERPTVKDIEPILPCLECSECGLETIEIEFREDRESSTYLATSHSGRRGFHREHCSWMKNVPKSIRSSGLPSVAAELVTRSSL